MTSFKLYKEYFEEKEVSDVLCLSQPLYFKAVKQSKDFVVQWREK